VELELVLCRSAAKSAVVAGNQLAAVPGEKSTVVDAEAVVAVAASALGAPQSTAVGVGSSTASVGIQQGLDLATPVPLETASLAAGRKHPVCSPGHPAATRQGVERRLAAPPQLGPAASHDAPGQQQQGRPLRSQPAHLPPEAAGLAASPGLVPGTLDRG